MSSPTRLEDGRLVARHGSREYEIPEVCPHRGAPLVDAYLNGPFLRCAWHGATFDIRTGERLRGPVCPNLPIPESGSSWHS